MDFRVSGVFLMKFCRLKFESNRRLLWQEKSFSLEGALWSSSVSVRLEIKFWFGFGNCSSNLCSKFPLVFFSIRKFLSGVEQRDGWTEFFGELLKEELVLRIIFSVG